MDKDNSAQMRDQIKTAASQQASVLIQGYGTKAFYGETSRATALLSTREHCGILNYEPTELVITARAGTPLIEIEHALSYKKQMLGFEPPHFGRASLGGAIATGLSGPRRAWAGACKDFVLGVGMMNAKAESLKFGGEVMKNVAGYDVSRLMTGSFGTLGLITEVSIRVVPIPAQKASLLIECTQADALQKINHWAGQALPITASSWFDGQLVLRLEGARAALEAAGKVLGGSVLPELSANSFWRDLREHQHAYFAHAPILLRIAVPSVCPVLELPGPQWIEWGGAQRWCVLQSLDAEQLNALRTQVAQQGGHVSIFRWQSDAQATDASPHSLPRFHPLSTGLATLNRQLKIRMDPRGVFCPGRMTADW